MIRYGYNFLVPVFFQCFPYVFIDKLSVVIITSQIYSTCFREIHETNKLIRKFILVVFVRIPANKGRNVIISKFELQVVNFCTITIINSHHEGLNNWSSEHCLWCKQSLQIFCMNGYGVLAMENVNWQIDVECVAYLLHKSIT